MCIRDRPGQGQNLAKALISSQWASNLPSRGRPLPPVVLEGPLIFKELAFSPVEIGAARCQRSACEVKMTRTAIATILSPHRFGARLQSLPPADSFHVY